MLFTAVLGLMKSHIEAEKESCCWLCGLLHINSLSERL